MIGPAIAAPKMTAPASDRVAAKWIMRMKISGSPTRPSREATCAELSANLVADAKGILALGRMGVDRGHAPLDLVPSGSERLQRYLQHGGVLLVHMGIALVDLLAGGVAHHDSAEFGLELLSKMKRDLGRRGGERRAGGWAGAIEMRMRVGGSRARQGGGGHEASNADVDGHEAAARCSLSRFEHRLSPQRPDAHRPDAVPVAAKNRKTETVEGEGLAGLGDRARLVDDEAGDGGRLVVGQVPLQGAVEIADRNAAIDVDRAVGLRPHARHRDVVLIRDVADD